MGVDAITGSLKRVDTKYVKVTLDRSDKTAFIEIISRTEISGKPTLTKLIN